MKKLIIIVLLVALVLIIAGCGNKRILDFEYVFDYAIVRMPDGEVDGGTHCRFERSK